MNSKTIVAIALVMTATGVFARDWYVAKTGNDTTGDGTRENPYLTIKTAIGNAELNHDDVVYVGPGEYGADEGVVEEDCGQHGISRSRFKIPKGITLTSLDGRPESVRLVGRLVTDDPEGYKGAGDGAVRCVTAAAGTGKTVTLKGLTFADSASCWTNFNGNVDQAAPNQGGAVRVGSGSVVIADCVFTNCCGRGGVVHSGTTYNSRFVNCSGRTIIRTGKTYGCTFENSTISGGAIISFATCLNCTFVRGSTAVSQGNTAKVGNCLGWFSANPNVTTAAGGAVNNRWIVDGELNNEEKHDAMPFIAPFEYDYRLVDNGRCTNAVDKGDAEIVTGANKWWDIPEDYVIEPGRCHRGSQPAVVPAAGGVCVFLGPGNNWVNGRNQSLYGYNTVYIGYATSSNQGWRINHAAQAAAEGAGRFSTVYNYWRNRAVSSADVGRFPGRDGSVYQFAPVETNQVYRYKQNTVQHVFYVDCQDPNASDTAENAGSAAVPFRTIQAAVDHVTESNTLILVKPGVYDEGGDYIEATDGTKRYFRVFCRSSKACVIRSTDGAEKTIIKGAPDPETGGDGPNAYGGIYSSGWQSVRHQFSGFTFTDCHTLNVNVANLTWDTYGSAVRGSDPGITYLMDSVISNNTAHGSILYGCNAVRCLVADNRAQSMTDVNGCTGYNVNGTSSVFLDNTSTDYEIRRTSRIYNCAMRVKNTYKIFDSDVNCYNSAVNGNGKRFNYGEGYSSYAWNYDKAAAPTASWTIGDAKYVDPANGDLRLRAVSPAAMTGGNYSNLAVYGDYTMDGFDPVDEDGRVVCGAYRESPRVVEISANRGGLAIDGGHPGVNVVSPEMNLVLTCDAAGAERPILGYTLNGEKRLFSDCPSTTITAEDMPAGVCFEIAALYATDWYVSKNGSDSNHGYTADAAFETLAKALTNRFVEAGDTIHVGAGDWSEGEFKLTESAIVANRVIVPEGVTLKGEDPETTRIIGGSMIRPCYLRANARIENCMLTGGDFGKTDLGDNQQRGAGLRSADSTTLAYNCIISNNCGWTFAAGHNQKFVRCRIVDNKTYSGSNGSPAGSECSYSNCVIDYNDGLYTTSYGNFFNCTFGLHNNRNGAAVRLIHFVLASHTWNGQKVINCILPGEVQYQTDKEKQYYRNCVIATTASSEYFADDVQLVDKATIESYLNDDLTLKPGAPLIDAGSKALVATYKPAEDDFSIDFAGGQRRYNGEIDIGALEYDYRDTYRKRMRSRSQRLLKVTCASPDVTTNAVAGVDFTDGASVSAVLTLSTAVRCSITSSVAGAGAFTVKVNGQEVVPVDGVYSFAGLAGPNSVEIAYEGEGAGTIVGIDGGYSGFMVLVF